MKVTVAVILLFVSCALGAQQLTADKTDVLIGDPIEVTLTLPPVPIASWRNPAIEPGDTVATIQVLTTEEPTVNSDAIIKKWTIAVYDTGIVRIPPIPVVLDADTFYSNDIPVQIEGVVDSSGLIPIKPIIYEPAKLSDYLPYILGLIGAIALGWGIYWWVNRPKKEQVTEPEEIVELPAHVIALQQLDELSKRELWQNGQVAEYHSALSHILREYLTSRYNVAALESTTDEVSRMLKPVLDGAEYEAMMKMMRLEDLIKFAKAEPPEAVHEEHMQFTRSFIERTRIETISEEQNA